MRLLAPLIAVTLMTLSSIGSAEARLFEPQANWWQSGRTCVSTRAPAGRRWDDRPPRACRAEPQRAAFIEASFAIAPSSKKKPPASATLFQTADHAAPSIG
jgi:hypothetical protein